MSDIGEVVLRLYGFGPTDCSDPGYPETELIKKYQEFSEKLSFVLRCFKVIGERSFLVEEFVFLVNDRVFSPYRGAISALAADGAVIEGYERVVDEYSKALDVVYGVVSFIVDAGERATGGAVLNYFDKILWYAYGSDSAPYEALVSIKEDLFKTYFSYVQEWLVNGRIHNGAKSVDFFIRTLGPLEFAERAPVTIGDETFSHVPSCVQEPNPVVLYSEIAAALRVRERLGIKTPVPLRGKYPDTDVVGYLEELQASIFCHLKGDQRIMKQLEYAESAYFLLGNFQTSFESLLEYEGHEFDLPLAQGKTQRLYEIFKTFAPGVRESLDHHGVRVSLDYHDISIQDAVLEFRRRQAFSRRRVQHGASFATVSNGPPLPRAPPSVVGDKWNYKVVDTIHLRCTLQSPLTLFIDEQAERSYQIIHRILVRTLYVDHKLETAWIHMKGIRYPQEHSEILKRLLLLYKRISNFVRVYRCYIYDLICEYQSTATIKDARERLESRRAGLEILTKSVIFYHPRYFSGGPSHGQFKFQRRYPFVTVLKVLKDARILSDYVCGKLVISREPAKERAGHKRNLELYSKLEGQKLAVLDANHRISRLDAIRMQQDVSPLRRIEKEFADNMANLRESIADEESPGETRESRAIMENIRMFIKRLGQGGERNRM